MDGIERSAMILFASETGNSQDVAEEISAICYRLRFSTRVVECNAVGIRELLLHRIVVFVVSTTGQGDVPANAQVFWRKLRSVQLLPGCLRSLRFASFGLGDSSYPKFNLAHRKLYNRLLGLGAQPICEKGEADDQHPEGIDGTFIPWSVALRRCIVKEFPLPEGEAPIPDEEEIQPKWILDFMQKQNSISRAVIDSVWKNTQNSRQRIEDVPPEDHIPIPNSINALVDCNDRITHPTHFQDTRHVILTLPGRHKYAPGATLTIYPKNFPSDVGEFLALMSWDDVADQSLKFVPFFPNANLSTYPPPPIPYLPLSYPLTLRTLLTNFLDIMSIPRRTFFKHLIHYTTDEMHLERLHEFTSPELVDELYDYTTRPRRSILETLADFPAVKIPWQRVCSIIPLIRGRQFSIASGGTLSHASSLPAVVPDAKAGSLDTHVEFTKGEDTRIDLLIAIVRYRTIIRRLRHGLATRYIAALPPGAQIAVTLQPQGGLGFRREDLARPVVMVAPGTGVAPMRALAWERSGWRAEEGVGERSKKDLLFFGCRRRGMDEYFAEEWEGLGIERWVAASREKREKVYVQDLIRQQSASVFEALGERGGIVFVCGSSGKMPLAVREALIEVFQREGEMERTDAERYFTQMEKDKRYKQETW